MTPTKKNKKIGHALATASAFNLKLCPKANKEGTNVFFVLHIKSKLKSKICKTSQNLLIDSYNKQLDVLLQWVYTSEVCWVLCVYYCWANTALSRSLMAIMCLLTPLSTAFSWDSGVMLHYWTHNCLMCIQYIFTVINCISVFPLAPPYGLACIAAQLS